MTCNSSRIGYNYHFHGFVGRGGPNHVINESLMEMCWTLINTKLWLYHISSLLVWSFIITYNNYESTNTFKKWERHVEASNYRKLCLCIKFLSPGFFFRLVIYNALLTSSRFSKYIGSEFLFIINDKQHWLENLKGNRNKLQTERKVFRLGCLAILIPFHFQSQFLSSPRTIST